MGLVQPYGRSLASTSMEMMYWRMDPLLDTGGPAYLCIQYILSASRRRAAYSVDGIDAIDVCAFPAASDTCACLAQGRLHGRCMKLPKWRIRRLQLRRGYMNGRDISKRRHRVPFPSHAKRTASLGRSGSSSPTPLRRPIREPRMEHHSLYLGVGVIKSYPGSSRVRVRTLFLSPPLALRHWTALRYLVMAGGTTTR